MRQIQRQDRVAGLQCRTEDGDVGRGAGVGLNVYEVGIEELLGALACQVFDGVHVDTAAVVAPARISLGVLVREDRGVRGAHRARHVVLRRDQL